MQVSIKTFFPNRLRRHDHIIAAMTQLEKVVAIRILRQVPLVGVHIALLDKFLLHILHPFRKILLQHAHLLEIAVPQLVYDQGIVRASRG